MGEQWKCSLFQKSLKSTPNLGGKKFSKSDDDLPQRFFSRAERNRYFVFDNRPTFRCIISVFKKFGNMGAAAEGEKNEVKRCG